MTQEAMCQCKELRCVLLGCFIPVKWEHIGQIPELPVAREEKPAGGELGVGTQ